MRQTNLLNNIDTLMDKKGIRFYSDLLYMIGKKLCKNNSEARDFAEKEKSNFTKILKGERPLNYKYIIPLEEIFGVPLAKIQNPQNYLDLNSINREDIPYLKSFRYYAYKDEYELYDELYSLNNSHGYPIIETSDEFSKTIFDYFIEYNAYNGLRYFVNKHNLKYNDHYFSYDDDKVVILYNSGIEYVALFAKFIANSNDADIFTKVFNPVKFLLTLGDYTNSIYTEECFIEALVNNEKIFDLLFKTKVFEYSEINRVYIDKEVAPITVVNPLLNLCLDFCLDNIETYKTQAKKIIELGITFNVKSIQKALEWVDGATISKLGNMHHVGVICGNIINSNIKSTSDEEINQLLNKMIKQTNSLLGIKGE